MKLKLNQQPLSNQPPRPNPSQKHRKRFNLLGTEVDALSREHALDEATDLMLSLGKHQIITANSLLLLEAQKSEKLKKACAKASLVLPDSAGLTWATRRLYTSHLDRYPGIDFVFNLCGRAEALKIPVYLLGGKPGIAKRAAKHLFQRYPSLVIGGMRDGYFKETDEPAIFHDIAQSRSRLILVALGMPKQDIWIHEKRPGLPPGVYVGVGGTFDVWAGEVQRAPQFFQHRGLEWLYRLKQEPFRWSRVSRLPMFALKILRSKKTS